MNVELKVPELPESVADAIVAAWRKRAGEAVRRDEVVAEIETDKVVLEVPAPADGVLAEIVAAEGATVTAGQLLGRIASGGATVAPPPTVATAEDPPLSPSVRRLVMEHDLDPAAIGGSGKGGRLLKEDVMRYLEEREKEDAPTPPAPHAAPQATVSQEEKGGGGDAANAPAFGGGDRPERRERLSRLRARVAERLVAVQQEAAILTTFNEIDMHAVMALRTRHRDAFEKRHGVRLGFMSFFVRAVAEALRRFPVVNASIDGDEVVYHGYYDIGIAVSSPRGLVVPVLRNADGLPLAAIEGQIAAFAGKASAGTLDIAEMSGGTFTITNGGVFGSLLSTPIINPPQSAILGMHKIQERPVAVGGEVAIRPMMYVALSYDHRLIDGRDAVSFLVAVKEYIEEPERLLLE